MEAEALHLVGAVVAVQQVLPDMRARGDGTLLLTTGVSSTVPAPFLADVGMAMSGCGTGRMLCTPHSGRKGCTSAR